MELKSALRSLRQKWGAVASAVISRDGLIIAADVPEGVSRESFGIMCATLLGAASTAHSELRIGTPVHVIVDSDDAKMIVTGAGRKALLVAVIGKKSDIGLAVRMLDEIADNLKVI